MDARAMRRLKPRLKRFLGLFADCFHRQDTRAHLTTYVRGQLSDLPRKSVEPIALAARVPPRTLQNFLSVLAWDHDALRQRLAEVVAHEHPHVSSVGVIDETSDDKNGVHTPGVQRQWCGSRGKEENCIVTVHLAYATPEFHCLLDGDLFLPESWSADRERCRKAGIPDDVVYRPKWRIALERLDAVNAAGVTFRWLTFDEGYGGKPEFLRELTARRQKYVAEVPTWFSGWATPPKVAHRPFRRRGSRSYARKTPRLRADSPRARRVAEHLQSHPTLRRQAWVRYRIKDGEKGPLIWEVRTTRLILKDEAELPGETVRLIVARNPLDGAVKYFLSNDLDSPLTVLLKVAFSRWRVERCFEDQKGEIGLDHYEGRTWQGLIRHLLLSHVSYLFLATVHAEQRGEKPGADGVSGAYGDLRPGEMLVA